MKAYKGFCKSKDGRMYCKPVTRKFYYKEGRTYTLPEGEEPKLCECGFHACALPIDVFAYYNSGFVNVEFHEVELEGVSEERLSDSKVTGNKITIGRKITPEEMVEISIQMMLEDKEKYFGGKDVIVITKDTMHNYLTTDGKILSETWFETCEEFKDCFAVVKNGIAWNYIGTDGKLLSEQLFTFASPFVHGFGRVKPFLSKWNYVGRDGKLLLEKGFDYCSDFMAPGIAIVSKDGMNNLINTDGKLLSKEWFNSIVRSIGDCNTTLVGRKGTKIYCIDKDGKLTLKD